MALGLLSNKRIINVVMMFNVVVMLCYVVKEEDVRSGLSHGPGTERVNIVQ